MTDFSAIETWVFDLDNTIYNANAHVFVEMQRLMQDYMVRELGIAEHEAAPTRSRLWQGYGGTMRGLVVEYGIDPVAFLEHSHDIDLAPVPRDPELIAHLERLPGRKFIFSNTARSFAARMTAHLDIEKNFDGVFVVEDAEFRPKPDPHAYAIFLKKYGIDPKTACMFEDSLPNLEAAHALGMATVWITGYHRDPQAETPPYVNARAESLNGWLAAHLSKTITAEGKHVASVH